MPLLLLPVSHSTHPRPTINVVVSPRVCQSPVIPCLHLQPLSPGLCLDPAAPPWLLAPSSPPWPISPSVPPGSLVPPAPPWSFVDHPPPWDSNPLAAPHSSVPLALSNSLPTGIRIRGRLSLLPLHVLLLYTLSHTKRAILYMLSQIKCSDPKE